MVVEQAAVPVVGVLAEADVGDDDQLGLRLFEGARRLLDDPIGYPCAAAFRVLRRGQPEEEDRRNVERA